MSDSSDLSSVPSDVEELVVPLLPMKQKTLKLNAGKLTFAVVQDVALQSAQDLTPPREPSPPHEYVLADNPDIAFLVMFRHRFADAFTKNVPNLGPQDIEQGIVDTTPSEPIDNLLCALLGLVLNRKKDIERGHYRRALEDAISSQRHQWPAVWNGVNPLPGQRNFPDMDPEERLSLLKALALWSLTTSDLIRDMIAAAYRQSRKDDDLNQPLSVQPWGLDGRKRKYWLIEGQNDTSFRIYKQSSAKLKAEKWRSIAGSIDELKETATSLRSVDGSQAARRLADRMDIAVPRLEASEEKRRRKEYRQARKAAFTRPEPGFSLYEGRTRGKRMKYTFSDDGEEDPSDYISFRRSNQNSGRSTPVDPSASTMTSSGRQVRSRYGRSYGDPIQQDQQSTVYHYGSDSPNPSQDGPEAGHRTRAQGNAVLYPSRMRQSLHGLMDDEDAEPTDEEWQGNDADVEGKMDSDEDDDMSDNASEDSLPNGRQSLIVTLRYPKNLVVLGNNPSAGTTESDASLLVQQNIYSSGVSSVNMRDTPPEISHDPGLTLSRSVLSPKLGSKKPLPSMHVDERPSPLYSSGERKSLEAFKPDPYGPYEPEPNQSQKSNINGHSHKAGGAQQHFAQPPAEFVRYAGSQKVASEQQSLLPHNGQVAAPPAHLEALPLGPQPHQLDQHPRPDYPRAGYTTPALQAPPAPNYH